MQLLDLVGTYFAAPPRPETAGEHRIATDILRRLLFDADIAARRRLAETLARQSSAPLELVDLLANDDPEVARHVLGASHVLTDAELREIAGRRSVAHRIAIARRPELSEGLTRTLLDHDEEDVMRAVLENPGARISRPCMERCIERARCSAALQAALAQRRDIDPDLVERLHAVLPEAVRRDMEHRPQHGRSPIDADGHPCSRTRMAAALAARRTGDPSSLVTLLRAGNLLVFEATFAEMAALPAQVARRVLHEPGHRPLAVACKAIGVHRAQFVQLIGLLRQARRQGPPPDQAELDAATDFFDAIDRAAATQTLARWRDRTERAHGRTSAGRRVASCG